MAGVRRVGRIGWGGRLALVTLVGAGCALGPVPLATFEEGVEHMPGPASVWVTADPAVAVIPVRIDITDSDDPAFHRSHTFRPGEAVRGDIPTSEGRYRLAGQGGACAIDLVLAPDQEADVVITTDASGGCAMALAALHASGDPLFPHLQPGVLIAPGSLPTDEPPTTVP